MRLAVRCWDCHTPMKTLSIPSRRCTVEASGRFLIAKVAWYTLSEGLSAFRTIGQDSSIRSAGYPSASATDVVRLRTCKNRRAAVEMRQSVVKFLKLVMMAGEREQAGSSPASS